MLSPESHRVEMCGKRDGALFTIEEMQTAHRMGRHSAVRNTMPLIADNNNSDLKYDMNVYDNAFKRPLPNVGWCIALLCHNKFGEIEKEYIFEIYEEVLELEEDA